MDESALFTPAYQQKGANSKVDFDVSLDPGFDPALVMFELAKQIDGGYPFIDQTGFYLDPLGALGWAKVSRQKEYAEGTRGFPYSSVSEMVGHVLSFHHVQELDIIILGPGEADVEAILAQHMAPFLQRVRVFLIEASNTLLRRAKMALQAALAHAPHASVHGIEGNLLDLWKYLDKISPPHPNRRRVVIALTVIYNLQDELHFIHNNFVRMSKGDLFLFNFWQTLGTIDKPEDIAKAEPRLAGTHVRVGWDEALDEWHHALLKRYCEGLEEVRFSYEMSTTMCPIPESYAIDKLAHIRCRDRVAYTVVLQRFKRYPAQQLVQVMQREGWLPVNVWPSRKAKNELLYLFEKTESRY